MTVLDQLPDVDSFFGVDLKTGSMVVASIGIIHPTSFGCTFFLPLSYLLVTIWIMVALFFAASVVLFCGVYKKQLPNKNVISLEEDTVDTKDSEGQKYEAQPLKSMEPNVLSPHKLPLSFLPPHP
ncbi:uncharacterized protein LOC101736719 isoform X2 [Bombyx mori]|uniref:uncharacterized protein LOC101736719 isoform X2 n=1 Tax=Bombyx mori TaxID=7091 RepID=UPI002ED1DC59